MRLVVLGLGVGGGAKGDGDPRDGLESVVSSAGTLTLSQSILVYSTTGILNMQSLKRSAVMCSTQALSDINSLEKVLSSTVFCLLLYQIIGALFKKMINTVCIMCVTLLALWGVSTHTVILTGTPLVSGHIC